MTVGNEAAVSDICSRLLGRGVAHVVRIHGGRNSQVFRIDCESGPQPDRYVAKQYVAVPDDPRDRLGTEFRALELIRSCGIATVPAPIAMDAEARCAIYEFVPGACASLRAADDGDIRQAVELLADLKAVAKRSGSAAAEPASEACFSIDAIAENLCARVVRLRALSDDEPGVGALRRFLAERFEPFVATLSGWTVEQARSHGLRRDAVLPFDRRTLSPSDFGFHNALRDDGGRLRFVDFEYFGWDDPAKTIVDFLHHPAMETTVGQRRSFVAGALAAFAGDRELEARSRIVYPWFGLKWCLILLNEFVPADFTRRRFADATATNRGEVLHRQLNAAARLLDRVAAEHRHNPYFDR